MAQPHLQASLAPAAALALELSRRAGSCWAPVPRNALGQEPSSRSWQRAQGWGSAWGEQPPAAAGGAAPAPSHPRTSLKLPPVSRGVPRGSAVGTGAAPGRMPLGTAAGVPAQPSPSPVTWQPQHSPSWGWRQAAHELATGSFIAASCPSTRLNGHREGEGDLGALMPSRPQDQLCPTACRGVLGHRSRAAEPPSLVLAVVPSRVPSPEPPGALRSTRTAPAHRALLWQEPAPAGSPGPAGTCCPCTPPAPRRARRDEAEQRNEPVAGEGGSGSGLCPQGQPQPLRKGMVKSP